MAAKLEAGDYVKAVTVCSWEEILSEPTVNQSNHDYSKITFTREFLGKDFGFSHILSHCNSFFPGKQTALIKRNPVKMQ